jgi:hypothetical protein
VTRPAKIAPALVLLIVVVAFGLFLFLMPYLGHLPAAG